MRYLFIHQNFPGQFRHVSKALAANPGNEVVGLGDKKNLRRSTFLHPNIRLVGYESSNEATAQTHHYIRDFEGHIRRGQAVAKSLHALRDADSYYPDVIVVHPGWGEGLFIKDIYPNSRVIAYAEFYYQGHGADVGFDPEFPSIQDDNFRVRIKNSTQLQSLIQADLAIAPTQWQKSRYPIELQVKIYVAHEGIDTELVKPDPSAWVEINHHKFRPGDEIITYVARNLEPYRGFHTLIRALPKLQALRPNAKIIIVGGDDVSYGRRPQNGFTYRQQYCEEIQKQADWTKVFFVGKLSYENYLRVLQVSAVHVYLTYPFVLSWSMLEAMSAGCVLVASDTAPVREVITDGKNGYLTDFFSPERLADKVATILAIPDAQKELRVQARNDVRFRFDLNKICLPNWINIISAPNTDE